MMSNTNRSANWQAMLARVALLITLLSAAGTKVQAQVLGKLRRVVAERVTPRPPEAPRLEVTIERIDVFLTAMQPAIAHAMAVQTALQAQVAYEGKTKQWAACKERVGRSIVGRPPQLTMAQQERLGALSVRTTELVSALQSAGASGNVRVANAIQDSMDMAGMEVLVIQYPSLAACGMPAPRPLPPPPSPTSTQGELIAEAPGGMTGTQFGRLREMIAVFLLVGQSAPEFTPAEQSAFRARSKELAPLEPLFRSGALEWARWESLGKNWHAR